MMRQSIRHLAAAAFTVVALSGCAGSNLGALGDILGGAMGGMGGGQQGQVVVEVQGVDTRQQVIQVRTEQGQQGNVMFDQNTTVVYQNQQYPVTALERGDVVAMQLQQTQQGQTYVSQIVVQQSVQERTGQGGQGTVGGSGPVGQLQQMYGRVGQIDQARGIFQLQTQQGTYVVTLPYNPGNVTTDYFNRLRTGDNVRVEGTITGNGRVELYRFI
ncbi:hypothetical protein [Longimicrobium sp.]|uniref:hypothetical protein n=1 Tax=Longimicrobium sp. TaxID=2029185 RepID=UPI003B3AC404